MVTEFTFSESGQRMVGIFDNRRAAERLQDQLYRTRDSLDMDGDVGWNVQSVEVQSV